MENGKENFRVKVFDAIYRNTEYSRKRVWQIIDEYGPSKAFEKFVGQQQWGRCKFENDGN